jgi:hypothetical protein
MANRSPASLRLQGQRLLQLGHVAGRGATRLLHLTWPKLRLYLAADLVFGAATWLVVAFTRVSFQAVLPFVVVAVWRTGQVVMAPHREARDRRREAQGKDYPPRGML